MSSKFAKESGGIAQISVSAALARLEAGDTYAAFVADEGLLYPSKLAQGAIPLSRWLLVKADKPEDVWRVGLEAIQTGLFGWVLLRPSRACHPHQLRKLQLSAERTRSRVLIVSSLKLPHWLLRGKFVEVNDEADSVSSEPNAGPDADAVGRLGGSLLGAHAQGIAP